MTIDQKNSILLENFKKFLQISHHLIKKYARTNEVYLYY